ncbi:MAG: hypothetical protein ACJA0Q_001595 [Saprospiraceae bacterium]
MYVGIGGAGFYRTMSGLSNTIFSISYSLGIEVEKEYPAFDFKSGLYFQRKGKSSNFLVANFDDGFQPEEIPTELNDTI